MPMDRLTRGLAGCGLALLATATGCRSMRDEVPPGRAYRSDGRQEPRVGFNTQPHMPPATPGQAFGGVGGNLAPSYDPTRPASGGPTGTAPGSRFSSSGAATGLGQPPALNPPSDITQTGASSGLPPSAAPPGGGLPPVGGQLAAPGNDPSWSNPTPGAGPPAATSRSWGTPPPGGGGNPKDPGYLNGFPNTPPPAGSMGSPGQPPSPL
jgi:hypothetical protein